jgi:hypothetical protein
MVKKNDIGMWILCVVGLVVISMCVSQSCNYEHLSGDVSDGKPNVNLYHSKGCPHCENFMSTWNKLKKNNNHVKFNEYEKDKHPDKMNNIKGFPTITKNGIEYKGDRSFNSLNDFISNKENFSEVDDSEVDEEEDETQFAEDEIEDKKEEFIPGYSDTEYFTVEQLEEEEDQ